MTSDMLIAGRAMPVVYADVFEEPDKPFGLLTEALDQLQPGEYGWAAAAPLQRCEVKSSPPPPNRGAVGAVVDGYHRDTPKVLEQNWPVYSRGRYAADSAPRNMVLSTSQTIIENGVIVRPGDLIFADLDGVLVVPQELETEVVTKALARRGRKNRTPRNRKRHVLHRDLHTYGVL